MSYEPKMIQELREMSSEDLKNRIQDIEEAQLQLRAQKEVRKAVNPGQWRNIKKEKAKILTILGERKRLENGKQMGGFRQRFSRRRHMRREALK